MAAAMKEGRLMDSLSDEDWLVHNARSCLQSNPYASRAWLITAQTLFPRNFQIQFEAYELEKNGKNTLDAANHLGDMFVGFPQEPRLWGEALLLADALQSDNTDKPTLFLRDLFEVLPASLQCHILQHIAETITDVLQRCRLILLVLAKYPDRVPEQGVIIIDVLLSAEKHSTFAATSNPVNCFRKYLVCDVLPLVLGLTRSPAAAKHLYRWLQKAIEFYVCYALQTPPSTAEILISPDVSKPTRQLAYSGAPFKRASISGLSDNESVIPQPWQQLFSLLKLIGKHVNWNVGNLFELSSRELQYQELMSTLRGVGREGGEEGGSKQLLYCATTLLLHCLVSYSGHKTSTGGSSSGNPPIVLVEAFRSDSATNGSADHRSKRQKAECPPPSVIASNNIAGSNELIQNFVTAIKCWDLLHSTDSLEKDFSKLCQYWKIERWDCIKNFEAEMLIYKGFFKEAIAMLQGSTSPTKKQPLQLRSALQVACCYYCLGNFTRTCEMILQVVSGLSPGSGPPAAAVSTRPGRCLQFLICDSSQVLPYCVHMLITCFREKAFKTYAPDDMSLGHMIVLLQYDWPRYETLFADCLNKIRKQGNFTYNIFFNYVINIDILEEFAYLKTDEGGKVNLDILPISTKAIAQSRTMTRGVNKGVTEDFKVAMERQVTRTDEQMELVMRQFLLDERDVLQQSLL